MIQAEKIKFKRNWPWAETLARLQERLVVSRAAVQAGRSKSVIRHFVLGGWPSRTTTSAQGNR